uniref:Prolyl 4-hydroxylase alpha-subunit N-terminal domain-containing protein n=1 Tax=Clastoptera arizonana TaxID=38151 RepID=A0A1B6CY70_9HEMI
MDLATLLLWSAVVSAAHVTALVDSRALEDFDFFIRHAITYIKPKYLDELGPNSTPEEKLEALENVVDVENQVLRSLQVYWKGKMKTNRNEELYRRIVPLTNEVFNLREIQSMEIDFKITKYRDVLRKLMGMRPALHEEGIIPFTARALIDSGKLFD